MFLCWKSCFKEMKPPCDIYFRAHLVQHIFSSTPDYFISCEIITVFRWWKVPRASQWLFADWAECNSQTGHHMCPVLIVRLMTINDDDDKIMVWWLTAIFWDNYIHIYSDWAEYCSPVSLTVVRNVKIIGRFLTFYLLCVDHFDGNSAVMLAGQTRAAAFK